MNTGSIVQVCDLIWLLGRNKNSLWYAIHFAILARICSYFLLYNARETGFVCMCVKLLEMSSDLS